jgi:hypothetical protein
MRWWDGRSGTEPAADRRRTITNPTLQPPTPACRHLKLPAMVTGLMVTETLAPAPSLRHFTFYDPAPSTYRKVKLRYRLQRLLRRKAKVGRGQTPRNRSKITHVGNGAGGNALRNTAGSTTGLGWEEESQNRSMTGKRLPNTESTRRD